MAQEILLAHPGDPLHEHLQKVGENAGKFAAAFEAGEQGRAAGLLHDVGKAEDEFQKRIRSGDREGEKQPHAHHGAMLALERKAWAVAFTVNGHHAGLHNRGDVEKHLENYLTKAKEAAHKIEGQTDGKLNFNNLLSNLKDRPAWLEELEYNTRRTSEGWFAFEFFTRVLFSALIDADRLATEEVMDKAKFDSRARSWSEFDAGEMLEKLRRELKRRAQAAKDEDKAADEVLAVRREVGELAEGAASAGRGLFSLTVPTGGGKTLASMLFALAHAAHHNAQLAPDSPRRFRRIIVVIPYLSIIEQTAKELKDIFGDDCVLEHHSLADDDETPVKRDGSFRPKRKGKAGEPDYDRRSVQRRLAVENWSAPVVVTTSAQFFTSLFSRRPSSARKLHNISQSVVIFDEVQTLPALLLAALLSVVRELSDENRPYGCSMVFCTATQPAFELTDDFAHGLKNIRHIVPLARAREHYRQLKRVEYDTGSLDGNVRKGWDEIAREIMGTRERQALCVVNTRPAARELHGKVKALMEEYGEGPSGLFHLSTWMYPAHRREVLDEVRRRLESGERCVLVSTQCIEAGVDVDFPEAWRAFAPYDSIVQAAGRCNRNGKKTRGIVHVFRPEDESSPSDSVYQAATATTDLLRRIGVFDPHDPESFNTYFGQLYQAAVPEDCAIQRARAQLHFKEVHENFKFIDDDTVPVLILTEHADSGSRDTPAREIYENAGKRGGFFTLDDWRASQQYIVNLPHWFIEQRNVIPAFGDDENRLRVWQGIYRGGVNGYGLDVNDEGLTFEEQQRNI